MKFQVCIFLSILFTSAKLQDTETEPDGEPSGPLPKCEDYAEAENFDGLTPRAELRVSITVGQDDFSYTVNGITNTGPKIIVRGVYYDNAQTLSGMPRLNMNIVNEIGYFKFTYTGPNDRDPDRILFTVESKQGEQNYFEVIPPYSPYRIYPQQLRFGQINETSFKVVGPSKHNPYFY